MASNEADWDVLPKLVGFLILDKLYEVIDRIRFGGVSIYWHIIAEEYKEFTSVKKQVPMLMVPSPTNRKKRSLFSILENKLYSSHLSVLPNEIRIGSPDEICIGSCYGGWLAFANQVSLVIKLINPFKKVDPIELPPIHLEHGISENLKFQIKKVVLSADPLVSTDNYVVIATYGNMCRLRIFKSGQKKWGDVYVEDINNYTDYILHKKIFYAVDVCGYVIWFDPNSCDGYDKMKINVLHLTENWVPRVYIVESSKGELLIIHRNFVDYEVETGKVRKTNSVKVYKLILDDTSGTLNEVKSLDGDAVFIGFSNSYCVNASDFPNCTPNSIYFTNDFHQLLNFSFGPCDLGVYNMEQQSFGEHYKVGAFRCNNPIWIFPPL